MSIWTKHEGISRINGRNDESCCKAEPDLFRTRLRTVIICSGSLQNKIKSDPGVKRVKKILVTHLRCFFSMSVNWNGPSVVPDRPLPYRSVEMSVCVIPSRTGLALCLDHRLLGTCWLPHHDASSNVLDLCPGPDLLVSLILVIQSFWVKLLLFQQITGSKLASTSNLLDFS